MLVHARAPLFIRFAQRGRWAQRGGEAQPARGATPDIATHALMIQIAVPS